MALDALVTSAVETARTILSRGRLLATVSHVPYAGSTNDYAEPVPGTPVSREALVEDTHTILRGLNGEEHLASAQLTFLTDGVTVDPRDHFVLPGSSVPRRVLRVERGVLPGSGAPFCLTVFVE